MLDKQKDIIEYTYEFTFKDSRHYKFTLNFTYPDLKQIKPANIVAEKPQWTELEFCRCKNCSLDSNLYKYCPVAECLQEILETFKDVLSIEEVEVVMKSRERTSTSILPIQKALSSLIGMYLGTSECPILRKFSPMARFHLPFASIDETVYRSVSNYLLAQYFISKEGGNPDWELIGLKEFYKEVEVVNKAICRRLRGLGKKDANVNAIVLLDVFAKNLNDLFDKSLEEIKPLFKVYFNQKKDNNQIRSCKQDRT